MVHFGEGPGNGSEFGFVDMYETFEERASREADPLLAADLRFASGIAGAVASGNGLALAVGGYARDEVMGRVYGFEASPKDIDIEVYGFQFDQLTELLKSHGRVDLVGASFGIAKVTNPQTGNVLDFSIPREDSKVDKGHKGFVVTGNPDMTVREAARRRDLTINSLALNPLTGEMIDEYGGLQDIAAGVLRATDPELFGDDPLRVLRVMQFAGRFNFAVDPATAVLCRSLDLTELPGERLGEEWIKLMTKSVRPSVGLEAARELGVLRQLHPDLAILEAIPQEAEWHPEGNVWNHSKYAADAAAQVVRSEGLKGDDALIVLFGALCHDLGKATTTEMREKNGVTRLTAYGHEVAGVEPTKRFLRQLKMKNDVVAKILPIVREHLYHINNPSPTDKKLQLFAERLSPANVRLWDLVSRCDSNGRGEAFREVTPSRAIYERSLHLRVSERPAPAIMQGRDLIAHFGMDPGPQFRTVLDYLYDAQISGEFETVEDGVHYLRVHGGPDAILRQVS